MEKVKTTPDGEKPNRFSDMTGYIINPDEPPTWADAMSNLWDAYWNAGPGKAVEVPSGETIAAELERLTKLDQEGLQGNRILMGTVPQRFSSSCCVSEIHC